MGIMGKKWGNNVIGMGKNWMIPGVYEVFSGDFCSFHEVKKAGKMVVIAKKCMKKDLMKHGKCVLHKVYFSNF